MKKLMPWAVALLSAALMVACTPSGDDDDDDTSGTPSPSASGTPQPSCSAPDDFGTPTISMWSGQFQGPDGNNNYLVTVFGTPDAAEPFDIIQFEFWSGFGVFTGGYAAGSYAITGVETDYANCGLCALILGDATSSSLGNFYAASGGTVDVTTLDATPTVGATVDGTATSITYTERETSSPFPEISGGCTSAVSSAAFSTTLVDGN